VAQVLDSHLLRQAQQRGLEIGLGDLAAFRLTPDALAEMREICHTAEQIARKKAEDFKAYCRRQRPTDQLLPKPEVVSQGIDGRQVLESVGQSSENEPVRISVCTVRKISGPVAREDLEEFVEECQTWWEEEKISESSFTGRIETRNSGTPEDDQPAFVDTVRLDCITHRARLHERTPDWLTYLLEFLQGKWSGL